MRTFAVSLGAVAIVSVLTATPSFAQYEGPWCLYTAIGRGSVGEYCDMRSYEMCRARMTHSGSYCSPNPRYLAATGTERKRSKAKRKRQE
jgi:hypothetical protein